MSGEGIPTLKIEKESVRGMRLALVATSWYEQVITGLIDGAQRAAAELEMPTRLVHVAGSLELPVVCKALAEKFDVIVALGVIIRGDTPHFDYVCQGAMYGLTEVSLQTGIPIGNAVLTCETQSQALDRAGLAKSKEDKGYEATIAAVQAAATIKLLKQEC